MKSLPTQHLSYSPNKHLSDEDSLLVLAELIIDSYLENNKVRRVEIDTNEKKDYHNNALNK